MKDSLFTVDTFTNMPFSGNPAAVCILTGVKNDVWMQQVASEINLSETAFLQKRKDGFSLRWFTPIMEVDLCGHATLASAHILWETGLHQQNNPILFYTRSGALTAELRDDLIELNFPALPVKQSALPDGMLEAMGTSPIYVGKFGNKYLVEVENEKAVRDLHPDFSTLKKLPGRGIAVSSIASSSRYDIVSRYFAPWVGVDEDPVCGSSHCCLGPYYGRKLGKRIIMAYQASARGGEIQIRLVNDRVCIAGGAVTVFCGELHV